MELIVSIKQKDIKVIKNSILNIVPSAKITFINGGGKHHNKLLVEGRGGNIKVPLSCTPGDTNWIKSVISQMLKKLSKRK